MISNRIFVAAVAMLAWIAAGAQKRLTMQECIDMAVKNNYGIRAAEGEVEKSQLMQGSAWDLDKTSLSLKQDPTSGGSPDNSLTLSQSFDFPTVYALRRRSLKAETAVAKSRAGLSRKQLSAEVANAYGQMVFVIEKKTNSRGAGHDNRKVSPPCHCEVYGRGGATVGKAHGEPYEE